MFCLEQIEFHVPWDVGGIYATGKSGSHSRKTASLMLVMSFMVYSSPSSLGRTESYNVSSGAHRTWLT